MKQIFKTAFLLLAVFAVAGAGYYAGSHANHAPLAGRDGEAPRKILYYRNPMGQPDTSPVPKQD
ncbi:MAG TPA: hypothetical protein VKO83_07475, partial [Steroidobacteraceae bacterium]|nr:hypothetical protein [Steroidobacteraceae bacterium]